MIYLLRHCEIASDGVRRFYGQTDVPLSPRGKQRARSWQAALAGTPFDGIYASDLSRCVDTARIIAGDRSGGIQFFPELREICLGNLEGCSIDEFRNRFPDAWQKRGGDIARYTPEGGESFRDLQRRVVPVFNAISERHDGNILMVAHAGVIRSLLCHVLEMPLQHLFRIEQSYGCLNLLKRHEGAYRLVGINLHRLP